MRAAVLCLLATAMAGLAACGGGSSSSTDGGASASSATPPCAANDLRISAGQGNGATGHAIAPFHLRNASSHTCSLRGFPRVVLLDRDGPMGVAVKPRATDFFEHTAIHPVKLAPAAGARFHLAFEDAINGGNCPTAKGMRASLPQGGTLSVQLNGQLACPGGVSVSPFAPE